MNKTRCQRPFIIQDCLILASGSPRRKKFLDDLGLDFKVQAARIEETRAENESPQDFVIRVATEKAETISRLNPECWVLGADTAVVFENNILGKPRTEGEALRILNLLTGKQHEVLTGFCLCKQKDPRRVTRTVSTEVLFAPFSEAAAAAYVRTGEPFDKAGGYGIQGIGGFLVQSITGSYSNVVGLPLAEVVSELLRLGIVTPCGDESNW